MVPEAGIPFNSIINFRTHPDPDLDDHYFVEILRGIGEALGESPFTLLVNANGPQVVGEILLAPSSKQIEHASRMNVPLTFVHATSQKYTWVDLNNEQAAYDAVSHLQCGRHERVALINGKLEMANSQSRLQGYRKALEARGLPFDDALVENGRFSVAGGRQAMARLLKLKAPPTAVFTSNDQMAIGALQTPARNRTQNAPGCRPRGFR